MGCIYRILCLATGRVYVGQTAYSHPFVRFQQHQREARAGVPGELYDDMRTYGVCEFECSCVRVCENSQLNDLECYYAEQYGAYTWLGGYNENECGGAPVRDDVSDDVRMLRRRQAIWKRVQGKRR
jgi:hypothetical protein